jgi:NCS1 family nucleobase:cation symporter-1
VLIADYFFIRHTRLDLAGLYLREGPYWYVGGYNPVALIALAAGIVPCLPGFAAAIGLMSHVPAIWLRLYDYAWFVSFGIALLTYFVLMRNCPILFSRHRASA